MSQVQPLKVPVLWFDQFKKSLPKLSNKVIAITGTTSGTGFVAAKTAAELGATVLLLNRKSERSVNSLAALKKSVPSGVFDDIECDLQDLSCVRKAAKYINSSYERLDVLCNNAGVMALPDTATKDGFDVQMQTNHISHFLLTKELYQLLKKTAVSFGESRVVNHSSIARYGGPLQAKYFHKNGNGNLGGDSNMTGGRWIRYHMTKLANAVFTMAMKERVEKSGVNIKVVVAHPGMALTNLHSTATSSGALSLGSLVSLSASFAGYFAQSMEDGAIGLVNGIAGEHVESGDFYGPGRYVWSIYGPLTKIDPVDSYFANITCKRQGELLWKESEMAIEEKFVI